MDDNNPNTSRSPYARIERDTEATGMPTFAVILGTTYAGNIIDESDAAGNHLPRGRYAAWSAKAGPVGFFEDLEAAADAIADTWPAPNGPKGAQLPRAQADAWSVRVLKPMARYNTISAAADLYAEGGRSPSRAWKDAIAAEWQREIAATPIRGEGEYENCMSVLGGQVHTATPCDDPKMRMMPLCRTGEQNHLRTRYTKTKLDLTCKSCIQQRDRRLARLAAEIHSGMV